MVSPSLAREPEPVPGCGLDECGSTPTDVLGGVVVEDAADRVDRDHDEPAGAVGIGPGLPVTDFDEHDPLTLEVLALRARLAVVDGSARGLGVVREPTEERHAGIAPAEIADHQA